MGSTLSRGECAGLSFSAPLRGLSYQAGQSLADHRASVAPIPAPRGLPRPFLACQEEKSRFLLPRGPVCLNCFLSSHPILLFQVFGESVSVLVHALCFSCSRGAHSLLEGDWKEEI